MISWIKRNKLATVLLIVLLVVLFKNKFVGYKTAPSSLPFAREQTLDYATKGAPTMAVSEAGISGSIGIMPPIPPIDEVAPAPNVKDRLTITDTNLSLVVTNVRDALNAVISKTQELGGYMVSSNLTAPEDAPFATVTIRIPTPKREEAMSIFRALAYKVTSENVEGQDVTDEYVDIDAQLALLGETKLKFESIMKQAVAIDDILRVQQEISNIQSQIDNLKGSQNYLKQNADLSKVTIYLSTDELSLPYTPTNRFRPNVIVKQAFRSLLQDLQGIGNMLIWVGIYSVIWIPLVIVGVLLYRRFHKPSIVK